MENQITLSFTPGQLFAVIGAICLIVITVYLAKFLKEARQAAQEARELMHHANEVLDDFRTTKIAVLNTVAKIKDALDIAESIKNNKIVAFIKKRKERE